ncbi:hypothetical protein [Cryptosporangium sp. NPDC051539]|uniref:hypothetical protein n=1 Tax=Cryptosporangium sp. NPDC051539 TaxID=3363962 RepID=UPI0037B6C661
MGRHANPGDPADEPVAPTHPEEDGSTEPGRGGIRRGSAWSDAENIQLVDGVKAGRSIAELATAHERSSSAIRAQLAAMCPAELGLARAVAAEWTIRRLVRGDGHYDWRRSLRAKRRVYWSVEDDVLLRAAWTDREPLPVVAAHFGYVEHDVHKRLTELGLSTSYQATMVQMGATPTGVVSARARRESALPPLSVVVLQVNGVASASGPVPVAVSLHSSIEAAHVAVRELSRLHQANSARLRMGPASWWLWPRMVDSHRPVGRDESGQIAAA